MQQPCFLFPKAPGCPRWQFRRAVPAANFPRESPANRYCPSSARYRRLVRRTYSLFTLHYSLKTPGIGGLPKPPWPLWGWFGEAKPGGFRGQGHGLIHYSLFTLHLKCPSPFHMGLCLWESACYRIPQSKIKDFCQLPFAREPRAVPADNTHGSLLRIVTAPPVPGNVTWLKKTHRPKPPLPKAMSLS